MRTIRGGEEGNDCRESLNCSAVYEPQSVCESLQLQGV